MRLNKKTCIITGAGSGIGCAVAKLFAQEGASVVLAGRRPAPLETVRKEIESLGGRAAGHPCDVTREADVRSLVAATVRQWGRLDVLVNNAAFWMAGTVEQTSEAEWNQMMATNLKGVFLLSKYALGELRRSGGGSIINIASVLGLVGMKRRAAYSTSKGGLVLLTKSMALDHAGENIRVNCICPALVDTPMGRESLQRAGDAEVELAKRKSQIPLGRMGTPEDVAQLAVYLGSDESSWLTGVAIPLDGGFTAG